MMQKGVFFGSNGPEIQFDINGKGMGETLEIEEETAYVTLNLNVFNPLGGLESIAFYKGKINSDKRFKKIKEVFFIGDQDKFNYQLNSLISVEKNEIYRVEVIAKVGAVTVIPESDSYDRGFAYSNPIWIG